MKNNQAPQTYLMEDCGWWILWSLGFLTKPSTMKLTMIIAALDKMQANICAFLFPAKWAKSRSLWMDTALSFKQGAGEEKRDIQMDWSI